MQKNEWLCIQCIWNTCTLLTEFKKKKNFFGVFFSKNNFKVAKDQMCDKHDVAEICLIHDIVFYRYCTHPFSFDIK